MCKTLFFALLFCSVVFAQDIDLKLIPSEFTVSKYDESQRYKLKMIKKSTYDKINVHLGEMFFEACFKPQKTKEIVENGKKLLIEEISQSYYKIDNKEQCINEIKAALMEEVKVSLPMAKIKPSTILGIDYFIISDKYTRETLSRAVGQTKICTFLDRNGKVVSFLMGPLKDYAKD